jgi:hypothetical protein
VALDQLQLAPGRLDIGAQRIVCGGELLGSRRRCRCVADLPGEQHHDPYRHERAEDQRDLAPAETGDRQRRQVGGEGRGCRDIRRVGGAACVGRFLGGGVALRRARAPARHSEEGSCAQLTLSTSARPPGSAGL